MGIQVTLNALACGLLPSSILVLTLSSSIPILLTEAHPSKHNRCNPSGMLLSSGTVLACPW